MEVTNRVHIVSLGWEVARVVEPIFDLKADKVVLIRRTDGAFETDFEREMIEDLQSMERLDVEFRRANIYDLEGKLQAFTQAVKDHEDDDVYINVSAGSKITVIAGMMAAQATGATPFYVHSSAADLDADEVQTPEEPVFPEAGEISELPVFELRGPSPEQLRILGYLRGNDGATKKELIQFAEDTELPFIAATEAKSDEGRYRLLESHIIDPLTSGEYISVKKVGRQKEAHLEQRGIDALAAFPLDEETEAQLLEEVGKEGHNPPWNTRDTTISEGYTDFEFNDDPE